MPPQRAQRRLSSLAYRGGRLALVAYLSVVLLMTLLERWLVYPAPTPGASDFTAAEGAEDITFVSADGTKLHGRYYDRPQPRHVVLYCHGNGETVADNHHLMGRLRDRLDAAVFIFDYRGYGRSEGKPHEAGVVADGVAAAEWLAEKTDSSIDRLVVIGRSLGGGVAAAIAAERGAGALVLQSTFDRLTSAAASHYPWLPVGLLMRNRYDSVARLRDYKGPLLMSHGTADKVVPYRLGRRLFDACPSESKRWIEFLGRTHNQPQPAEYYPELRGFLDSHG